VLRGLTGRRRYGLGLVERRARLGHGGRGAGMPRHLDGEEDPCLPTISLLAGRVTVRATPPSGRGEGSLDCAPGGPSQRGTVGPVRGGPSARGRVRRRWAIVAGETVWEQIEASEVTGFDRPGLGGLACSLSLRSWQPLSALVEVVMCSQRRVVDPAASASAAVVQAARRRSP
jgi:hypothetical protein